MLRILPSIQRSAFLADSMRVSTKSESECLTPPAGLKGWHVLNHFGLDVLQQCVLRNAGLPYTCQYIRKQERHSMSKKFYVNHLWTEGRGASVCEHLCARDNNSVSMCICSKHLPGILVSTVLDRMSFFGSAGAVLLEECRRLNEDWALSAETPTLLPTEVVLLRWPRKSFPPLLVRLDSAPKTNGKSISNILRISLSFFLSPYLSLSLSLSLWSGGELIKQWHDWWDRNGR